ncbi:MAG TPA: PfkB family carbohydrate kinase [Streptosporangiaceae bacterium]|nr:PfkB family carbohydrate kinase [Streptosporangiaceae bacterium]
MAAGVGEAVAVIGDNTIDQYVGQDSYSFVGGNALNVAVQMVRLGRPARYFGAVGPDHAGQRIRDTLARLGVDVAGLVSMAGRTSVSRIRIDESGDRHFEFEDFGVCADYAPGIEALELAAECQAAHIGLLPLARPVRAWLARRGVLISQDCGVTKGYEHLDIAFCSQAAAGEPAEKIAQDAVAGGARLAIVTCGADGSLAFDGRTWWRESAVPVETVDTTGAGDSYSAGFLDARLAGADVGQAMKAGSAHAARTCTHIGAWLQDPLPVPGPTADR